MRKRHRDGDRLLLFCQQDEDVLRYIREFCEQDVFLSREDDRQRFGRALLDAVRTNSTMEGFVRDGQQLWQSMVDEVGYSREREEEWFASRVAKVCSIVGQATSILDFGCGSGKLTSRLASALGANCVVGVETADVIERCQLAERLAPMTPEELAGHSDHYDLVTVFNVLHHLDDPRHVLRSLRRLRPHRMLVREHTIGAPAEEAFVHFMEYVVGCVLLGWAQPPAVYGYASTTELVELFSSVGFSVLEVFPEDSRRSFSSYFLLGRAM